MPWPMFERVWQQERALHDMMARRGVNAIAAVRLCQGSAYHRAMTNCICCVHSPTCRTWLDGNIGSVDPVSICGNHAFFMACRHT